MAQRKRRSLLAGKGDSADGGEGVDDAASTSVPVPEPAPHAEPAPPPDPWSGAEAEPVDPWAAAPPRPTDNLAPSGFVEEEPPPPPPPPSDPWAATAPPVAESHVEVTEHVNKSGGLYTSVAENTTDTTDSGWNSSAFRGEGAGQPSLPPGWDTPDVDEGPKKGPASPWKAKAEFFSDEPPTEEMPSAVYEDRQPRFSAPMNVPESPIPGMQGQQPPAQPAKSLPPQGKSYVSAAPEPAASSRPSYLPADTPKKPQPRSTTPRPAPTSKVEDDDDEKGGIPIIPLIAVATVILVVVIVALGATMYGGFGAKTPPPPPPQVTLPPPPPPEPPPVPVDGAPVEVTPPLPPVPPDPATVTPPPKEPTTTTTAPPPPKVVVPKDPPKKEPKVAKSPLSKGTLKVRSNRRVLVKVNGQPKDYTPLDMPTEPGTYTVTAALPGKPDSEQTFTVVLKPGIIEPVNFTF